MKPEVLPGLLLYGYVEVSVLEVYGGDSFPPVERCSDGFRCFHFEFLHLEKDIQFAYVQYGSPFVVGFRDQKESVEKP